MEELEAKRQKQEISRQQKLSSIQNEIARWETWHAVPEDTTEIDLFAHDQNYFIDKKVPKDVQIKLKGKIYEPIQYDYDRAKEGVDQAFDTAMTVAETKYSEAVIALAECTEAPNSAIYKNKQKNVSFFLERKNFLAYKVRSMAELLPFDAVYGIRT
ncbi:MAG: hypothetical protein MUF58_21690, partial [Arcicella sp.]|nr:hypothetical protein [Arcicella sp.]